MTFSTEYDKKVGRDARLHASQKPKLGLQYESAVAKTARPDTSSGKVSPTRHADLRSSVRNSLTNPKAKKL
jgi:hypothetical protein